MLLRRLVLAIPLLVLALAAPAAAQTPITGLEERLANPTAPPAEPVPWTQLDEEAAFLAAVDGGSERMAIDVLGQSAQGRALRLARIGAPGPRSVAEAAAGQAVLLICSQHGDEPAGREGCLRQIRTLALSDDPAVVEHLRTTSVMVMPAANPDGRQANTRENAQGVDVNRDHLDPVTPEAEAIDTVVRDLRPDVVADMHEYNSRPLYDTELLYLWPRNRNVDPTVHALSRDLSEDYIEPGAERVGK